MPEHEANRREILALTAMFGAASGLANLFNVIDVANAQTSNAVPFGPDYVKQAADTLSKSSFVKPKADLPEPFNKLSYDQYRDIRFRGDQAIWLGEGLNFELQLFPMGWLYDAPVEVWIVEDGVARQLTANDRFFSLGQLFTPKPEAAPFGFSGFRVHGPLNRADYYDEITVFQGASYLRSLGRNQQYGVSARGLAVNTARPGGEEFPLFRAFWIEKPPKGASQIVIHALLDSPSTTGVYTFTIEPGASTVMGIDATLFPRKSIQYAGIAPLTSMFLHGSSSHRITGDFRPSVYDSEGLAVVNGWGERLWRPLCNPKMLQTSAFIDKNPRGFGLALRDRNFHSFEDLEARYERRPTVWVEPVGEWGEGFVELIEIPVDVEIHDNIVAYWRPANKLEPGTSYNYKYRLYWGQDVPETWTGARVAKTRIGTVNKPGAILFVVDFDGPALTGNRELPVAQLSSNTGTLSNVVVQRNPEIQGVRVTFELDPSGAELVELRLSLKFGARTISETWLYQWTKS